jgi:hypothetical protein
VQAFVQEEGVLLAHRDEPNFVVGRRFSLLKRPIVSKPKGRNVPRRSRTCAEWQHSLQIGQTVSSDEKLIEGSVSKTSPCPSAEM